MAAVGQPDRQKAMKHSRLKSVALKFKKEIRQRKENCKDCLEIRKSQEELKSVTILVLAVCVLPSVN